MQKIKHLLLSKNKIELLDLAQQLNIPSCNNTTKNELIKELLKKDHKKKLEKILNITWLDRKSVKFGYISLFCTIFFGAIPLVVNNEPSTSHKIDSSYMILNVSLLNYKEASKYFGEELTGDIYKGQIGDNFIYKSLIDNDTCKIFPWNNYLNEFHETRLVKFETTGDFFELLNPHNPLIDVKFVNNTEETIVVDKIIVEVDESKEDRRPLVMIFTNTDVTSAITFVKADDQDWEYCDFKFSFGKDSTDFNGEYRYHKRLNSFNSIVFNLIPFLKKEGVKYRELNDLITAYDLAYEDFKNFHKLEPENFFMTSSVTRGEFDSIKKLIPFCTGSYEDAHTRFVDHDLLHPNFFSAYLFGQLSFQGEEHPIRFEGIIPISTWSGGADFDINNKFDIKLKTNGENYFLEYPISLYIQPKEVERFVIQLSAPKSSHHKLRVRINNINERKIMSNYVNLDYFAYPEKFFKEDEE